MTARRRTPARRITCCNCRRADMPNRGHGWCPACYGRWYRAGMPDGPPPAPWAAQPLDEVAIELAVKGTRPRLTPQERRAAVAELREQGLSLSAVADRLGCSQRTVERHTAAIRTEA